MFNAQAFIYKAETFIYKLPTNQAEVGNFMHELSEQLLSLFSEPNGAQPARPKAEVHAVLNLMPIIRKIR